MFTGIIEAFGQIRRMATKGSNKTFWVESSLFSHLKVDQSLAHNGVCLTIESLQDGLHQVTAVKETLEKTSLLHWAPGTFVNLERSLQPSGRLDGHFVQGHVDATGICQSITDCGGSTEIVFGFPEKFAPLVIEKGSICIDGISLTAFDVRNNSLKVAIIPYTFEHTNLQFLKEKGTVNLEFDMIGKYLHRKLSLYSNP
jgi:riboflavin synthase